MSDWDAEVTVVAPGVGEVACPECGGEPEKYASLFPSELGITECMDCKGSRPDLDGNKHSRISSPQSPQAANLRC